MDISQDTNAFIDIINDYANQELRKKNDLALCVEIAASYSGQEELNQLIFEGKVFWNLFSKIKNSTADDKGIELIQNEFEKSLVRLKEYLSIFIEKMDEKERIRFEEVYYQMTRGCILNLSDFSHDLAKVKDFMIIQKNK